MDDETLSRRGFVRAAGGATALAATAAAAEADSRSRAGARATDADSTAERPDFGGYTDGAKGGEFRDARGQQEVTVTVGAGDSQLAFAPTELWIDPGTTVVFEWVGGAQHNVVPEETPEGADWAGQETLQKGGFTYEHTFETNGIYTYFCQPHKAAGMKGGIAVGDDVPTTTVEETPTPTEDGDGGDGSEGGGEDGGEGGDGGDGGGGGRPDFGGYIEDAQGGEFADMCGQSEVSVTVGGGSSGLAFIPTGLWIDPGTTVTFEWVGQASHNVVPESVPGDAGWEGYDSLENGGFTYEHTFDTGGIYTYFCQPHKGQGMKGAIAVGDDVPTLSPAGGGQPVLPREAKTLTIAAMAAMGSTLALAYFFMKYGGNRTRDVDV